jgi:hypothetical protein
VREIGVGLVVGTDYIVVYVCLYTTHTIPAHRVVAGHPFDRRGLSDCYEGKSPVTSPHTDVVYHTTNG